MKGKAWVGERPHIEQIVTCKCGHRYCIICHTECPACRGKHLAGNKFDKFQCQVN